MTNTLSVSVDTVSMIRGFMHDPDDPLTSRPARGHPDRVGLSHVLVADERPQRDVLPRPVVEEPGHLAHVEANMARYRVAGPLRDDDGAICGSLLIIEARDADDARSQKWQLVMSWAFFGGHWLFSKTIKLVPHLLRNPGDVRFVAVSVLFGYFHNIIKMYGCITVTEVRCRRPALR